MTDMADGFFAPEAKTPTKRAELAQLIRANPDGSTLEELTGSLDVSDLYFRKLLASLRVGLKPVKWGNRTWDRGPEAPMPIVALKNGASGKWEYWEAGAGDAVAVSDYKNWRVRELHTELSTLQGMLNQWDSLYGEDDMLRVVRRHIRNAVEELAELLDAPA
jgi:hypothetical protein